MFKPEGERAFETYLTMLRPSLSKDMVSQHRFHNERKWKFDFAWPDKKIAVEIDGGQWAPKGGRHNRDSDREKINAAASLGWRVFRFSNQQIKNDPGACIQDLWKGMFV